MSQPPELERLDVFKTDLPPCCLRIYKDVVYLGTYKLVKGDDRYGSIEVWRRNKETGKFAQIRTYPTSGAILDLKMDPFEDRVLCSCHSTGNLIFWKIDAGDASILTRLSEKQLYDSKTLITSINYHKLIPHKMTLTTTTGICSVYDTAADKLTNMGTTHDLECWYADFCSQPGLENLVVSGGDDRRMIIHDLRDSNTAIFNNDRIHGAGVVAVLASSKNWCSGSPNTIWTGSYDDQVRSIDLRYIPGEDSQTGSVFPKTNQAMDLGGGVWKLIPSPIGDKDPRVLTCCMYDGARMLSYNPDTGSNITVKNYFKRDHSSICYGGDWKDDLVVTCSFYDNVVQAWSSK